MTLPLHQTISINGTKTETSNSKLNTLDEIKTMNGYNFCSNV